MPRAAAILLLVLLGAACDRPPAATQYELKGQILGVKPEEREVLIKHGDIKGFMPGMTMPFKVRDAALLTGRQAGDLVTATLVVEETDAHLSSLTKTGSAPLDVPPAAPTDARSGFELLRAGQEVPDQLLIDQDGKPKPLASLRGHRVALTFTYTRCPMPTFCPMMDRNFAALQKEISQSADLGDVRLLSISFDPEFDSPKVLKAHAKKLEANPQVWSFVTGDRDDVERLAARFGLALQRDERDPTEISHTLRTALLDPAGRLITVHTGNGWTPADLLAEIRNIPTAAN